VRVPACTRRIIGSKANSPWRSDRSTPSPRELHELVDLGKAVRHERGDRNGADLLQREIEQHELGDVRKRRHHAIERLQPELEQVERQVIGELVDLLVGVAALAVHQRRPIFELVKDEGEFFGKRLVLPVAPCAVALRELRRKRHYARQHVRSRP
jgi:hypothetical protein